MGINLFGVTAAKANKMPVQEPGVKRRTTQVRAVNNEHTDTVTISQAGSLQREAARISRGVMDEIRGEERTDAARVADIKARVADRTYFVSTGAVADAMLEQVFGAQR